MKRQLTIGLMLAAAFTLTNCSEQLVTPDLESDITVDETIENDTPQGEEIKIPYEVFINEPATKTISDGENIFWVDEATAAANGMGKGASDRVNIFTRPSSGSAYTSHGAFVYAGGKRFVGELTGNLGTSNNWYCLYPYGLDNVTSASADIEANITIGATKESGYVQTQLIADSKAHIAGEICPMYDYLESQSGSTTPQFNMKHLSALLAIKIVNEGGDGDIIINSAQISVPTISTTAIKQTEEKFVGDFKVKISGDNVEYIPVANSSSSTAKLSFGGANFSIAPNDDLTLYLAIKPFDASGKTFDITINGAQKRVTIPSGVKFEAGKMTTLRVPLKLSYPTQTNVFDLQGGSGWSTYKLASLVGDYNTTETMLINGKEVDVVVLGTPAKPGMVQVQGTPQELINKVPINFYASSYGNNQGVMRVESITATFSILGIPIPVTFNYSDLISYVKPERIQFSGVLPLQQYERNGTKYITILDEEPIQKGINIENINNLLESFDDNTKDEFKPTFEGLKAALNNDGIDTDGTPANVTAKCICAKLKSELADNEKLSAVSGLFDSPSMMFYLVRGAHIKVVLSTVDKNDSNIATDNRVMAWGIHANAN